MRFTFLTGDMNWQTYGGKFISKRLNNGEFDYWLVMEVINWNEHEHNPQETYHVSLYSVSPAEAGEENLASAFQCCGMDSERDAENRKNPLIQVECLQSYGVSACIWQQSGNNLSKLMRECRKEASLMGSMLYGFAMDKAQNRIGTSGWDFQRGNILAGLNR